MLSWINGDLGSTATHGIFASSRRAALLDEMRRSYAGRRHPSPVALRKLLDGEPGCDNRRSLAVVPVMKNVSHRGCADFRLDSDVVQNDQSRGHGLSHERCLADA